jgi:23S rRNA (guanine2445-N2)-methyltransferase / 23S rRNA (guanine2069-N7)-methyltransferase
MAKAEIFTATVSRGAEPTLVQELRQIGLQRVVEERGAVRFMGPLRDGLRACMWSRVASRVLLRVARFQAGDADELYAGLRAIDWSDHLAPHGALWVDFVGVSKTIRNSQFGARLTKDAIVDKLRTPQGVRPRVDRDRADVRVHVHLRHAVATVSIDLSGMSLHWRTPGRTVGEAPLKETLAATMLMLCDWPARARDGAPFIDPMCGSGTILLEAAGMARDIAPGLMRAPDDWGFARWRGHQPKLWAALLDEAKQRAAEGASAPSVLMGSDIDPSAVAMTRDNARRLQLWELSVSCAPLSSLSAPDGPPGLLLTNPPYGERIGTEIAALYENLGDLMRRRLLGWSAGVLVQAGPHSKQIGLRTSRRHILFNGPLECRLLTFDISPNAPQGGKPPRDHSPSS